MKPYFIVLGIILLLYAPIKEFSPAETYKRKYNKLVCVILIIFISLRDLTVGYDLVTYSSHFSALRNRTLLYALEHDAFEPGYVIFCKVIGNIFGYSDLGFRVLLIAIAVFSVIAVYTLINRYSEMPWLSWGLYFALNFLIYPMSALRASVAMSFGILSINYLFLETNKKNIIRYYIFALLAVLFHKTSIVFVFLYPLCKIKKNWVANISLISLWMIVKIFSSKILEYLIGEYYSNYRIEADGGKGLFLFLIICLIISIIFVLPNTKETRENTIMFRILLLTLVMQTLTLEFSIFARITEFYLILLIIYIPFIIVQMKDSFSIFLSSVAVGVGMIYLLYSNLMANGAGIVPYEILHFF